MPARRLTTSRTISSAVYLSVHALPSRKRPSKAWLVILVPGQTRLSICSSMQALGGMIARIQSVRRPQEVSPPRLHTLEMATTWPTPPFCLRLPGISIRIARAEGFHSPNAQMCLRYVAGCSQKSAKRLVAQIEFAHGPSAAAQSRRGFTSAHTDAWAAWAREKRSWEARAESFLPSR